jgi:hypothetical protein
MCSTLADVAPTVLAKLINRLTDLHAWGRSPDGQWWALVSWELYGQLRGGNGHLHCSGWMPASTVHRTSNLEDDREYPDVPRLGCLLTCTRGPPSHPGTDAMPPLRAAHPTPGPAAGHRRPYRRLPATVPLAPRPYPSWSDPGDKPNGRRADCYRAKEG